MNMTPSKLTPQARLCHICACERHNLESEGFIPNGRASNQNSRIWYYVDPHRHKTAAVFLDLETLRLKIYRNGRLVNEY